MRAPRVSLAQPSVHSCRDREHHGARVGWRGKGGRRTADPLCRAHYAGSAGTGSAANSGGSSANGARQQRNSAAAIAVWELGPRAGHPPAATTPPASSGGGGQS
jgi:hypothetical protein